MFPETIESAPSQAHFAPGKTLKQPVVGSTCHRTKLTSGRSQQKDMWRSAVVKRSLRYIKQDLAAVTDQSPFLQRTPTRPHALLLRSEILTGKLLGKGGFSFVYEITGVQLNEQVDTKLSSRERQARRDLAATCLDVQGRPRYALKHLQEKLLESSKGPQEFQFAATDLAVEAAFLSRLSHNNVVACRGLPLGGLNAFQSGHHDAFFVVMDLAHDTLDYRIQTWELEQKRHDSRFHTDSFSLQDNDTGILVASTNERMQLALQIAHALAYLHANRIVFRDLKPSNIGIQLLPDGSERLLLMDFGLCRELPVSLNTYSSGQEDNVDLNEVFEMSGVGTRRYMAVEIVNTSCYNCKADVYSWAMLVWELLSHQRPFAPYTMEDHREYVCQMGVRPRLFWNEWPESICQLLQATWDHNVSHRLNMNEVVAILTSLLKSDHHLDSLRDDSVDTRNSSPVPAMDDLFGYFVQDENSTCPESHRVRVSSTDSEIIDERDRVAKPKKPKKAQYSFADLDEALVKTKKPSGVWDNFLSKPSLSFDCASTFMGSTVVTDAESRSCMTVSVSSMSYSATD
jgi:serine/threonine protein kinase